MSEIPKPKLERRERKGRYGETVSELTPESERAWAEYLRKKQLAHISLHKAMKEKEE